MSNAIKLFWTCLLINKMVLLSTECINQNIPSGRSYNFVQGSIIISDCLFQRTLMFDGVGGVICIQTIEDNGPISLIIGDTTFADCRVNNDVNNGQVLGGGAIYYENYFYQPDLFSGTRICAFGCESNHVGSFMTTILSSISTQYSDFFSISHCGMSRTSSYSIYYTGGTQTLKNSNISNNQALSYPSILFQAPISCSFCFCSIINNKANYGCIFFSSFNDTISYHNFVGNECDSDFEGVLHNTYGILTIDNSVFSQNTKCLFYNYEDPYYEESKTILYNCIVDHSDVTTTGVVIFLSNNSNPFVSIMSLSHYSTFYCPFIPTLAPTLEPTCEGCLPPATEQPIDPPPFDPDYPTIPPPIDPPLPIPWPSETLSSTPYRTYDEDWPKKCSFLSQKKRGIEIIFGFGILLIESWQ